MLKKKPEKIINGTSSGADKAKAAFEFGAAADKSEPLKMGKYYMAQKIYGFKLRRKTYQKLLTC